MQTVQYGLITEANYPESLVCICFNDASREGFMLCDAEGTPAFLRRGPVPSGFVRPVEEPHDGNFFACHSCGRVYSDHTIQSENLAPVITQLSAVDLHERQARYRLVNQV